MVQQPAVWNVYSSKGQGYKCVTENLWLSPFLFSVLGVLWQWYNNPQCEMSTAQRDRGINVWQRIYDYHHFYFQCSVSCDNGTTTRSVKCLQLIGTGEEIEVDHMLCPQPAPSTQEMCMQEKCKRKAKWKPMEWSEVRMFFFFFFFFFFFVHLRHFGLVWNCVLYATEKPTVKN